MVMVFRRSRSMQPINSFKHVVDASGVLVAATVSTTPILTAAAARNVAVPAAVAIGAKVSSFFVSIFVLGDTGASSNLVDWYIWRNPRNQVIAGNTPAPGNTGISPVRNFIIHEEKGLFASQDGTPMVFKGVIKVPKHMQRVADGDTWQIRILSPGTARFCIKVIFKDYQ